MNYRGDARGIPLEGEGYNLACIRRHTDRVGPPPVCLIMQLDFERFLTCSQVGGGDVNFHHLAPIDR